MVTDVTKKPKGSAPIAAPPRKINVPKFAEARASELQSLQCIVENRLSNDYKSQRNKRRRTTSFNDQIARKGRRRKRQKLGRVDKANVESRLKKDDITQLPRHVRRRYELKSNPENGFCTSGDGTKRLRTHVWHAKRFSMTKLWSYHLPLGLQGRGKGSRALLRKLKQGVLAHDASYYSAVQLEGPEDSLISILRTVLVPSPIEVTHPRNHDDSVLSGTTYGTAMLHQVGAPVSQAIAPVTYMWRPVFQENITDLGVSDEKIIPDVDLCDKSERMECSSSFRHLWVWIHASAFEEGYANLKLACQKELEKRGISINCSSLEGQLAKLELIGSGTFRLLQKILHPVRRKSLAVKETRDYRRKPCFSKYRVFHTEK